MRTRPRGFGFSRGPHCKCTAPLTRRLGGQVPWGRGSLTSSRGLPQGSRSPGAGAGGGGRRGAGQPPGHTGVFGLALPDLPGDCLPPMLVRAGTRSHRVDEGTDEDVNSGEHALGASLTPVVVPARGDADRELSVPSQASPRRGTLPSPATPSPDPAPPRPARLCPPSLRAPAPGSPSAPPS